MTTEVTLIDGVQTSGTSAENVYTSPTNGGGTRITAFTASLVSGSETYRVFIGATAATAKEIVPATGIQGPNHDVPMIIGQRIPAGDNLFVQTTTATTIAFRATGFEL